MTGPTGCTSKETDVSDETNAALRERIEAAKNRGADVAADTARKAKDLVHEHPMAAVAGGLVLGALVAGALSRRARRKTSASLIADAPSKLGKLAALGAEIALAYAAKAAEAGKDGVHKLEDIGGTVGEKLSGGSAEAKKRATDVADIALAGARAAGEAAIRRANEIASKIRH
jgi:hypothetical protein